MSTELPLCAQSKEQKEREKRWEVLNGQIFFYHRQGRYAERLRTAEQALQAAEAAYGQEHRHFATALNNLALSHADRGNYAEAERTLQRALQVAEKARGLDHYDVALILRNIAGQLLLQARFIEAEAALQRALRIEQRVWGPDHPSLGLTLQHLAVLYEAQGKYVESEDYLRRAVRIMEAWRFPVNPDEGASLSLLADLFLRQGRVEEAEALYRRVLKIAEIKAAAYKATGNPLVRVGPKAALATVARARGQYTQAETLLREAMPLAEQALGKEAPLLAQILRELGGALSGQGKYEEAAASYQRALDIYSKSFSPEHPKAGATVEDVAALYYAQGRADEAGRYFERRMENLARQFQYHFTYMSEKERLGFLDTVTSAFPLYFSFCYTQRERNPALIGNMYDVLLWQKGFVATSVAAMQSQIAARGDAEALALLDQLQAIKTRLARLITSPPEDREEGRRLVEQLEREANQLERSLVQRSASLAEEKRLERATWRDVQKALAPGDAAIEFARFRFHDGKRLTDTAYYVALIVTPESTVGPRLVLLGEAATLEGPVLDAYRRLVERRSGAEATGPPGAGSDFWRPLQSVIAGRRRLFVSPDGVLNLVSLSLLDAGDGRTLLDEYDLHLLASTKDLLRSAASASSLDAVLLGNPRFELSEEEQKAAWAQLGRERLALTLLAQATHSSALRSLRAGGVLEPLPGTAEELEAVGRLLAGKQWKVESYQQASALEDAVKRARRPRVLHVATHGFFLSDQVYLARDRSTEIPLGLENPMLRSGLFFAGAERVLQGAPPPAGMDDGALTAYEAAALDLQGTELVVLSACETGMGQVRNGEGVFGLRRAFQIAGARAVLMSLWDVPDRETQELMALFYENWLAGEDKHDSLRAAQQKMRKVVRERYGEDLPYYWGAFILVGE